MKKMKFSPRENRNKDQKTKLRSSLNDSNSCTHVQEPLASHSYNTCPLTSSIPDNAHRLMSNINQKTEFMTSPVVTGKLSNDAS
jgi:hypothetical protein